VGALGYLTDMKGIMLLFSLSSTFFYDLIPGLSKADWLEATTILKWKVSFNIERCRKALEYESSRRPAWLCKNKKKKNKRKQ
jgi:hypothetical protein